MAKLPKYYKIHTDGCEVALEPIYEELVPVVHGRWNDWGRCTNCGERCIGTEYAEWHTRYCPHCGAKMDGDK